MVRPLGIFLATSPATREQDKHTATENGHLVKEPSKPLIQNIMYYDPVMVSKTDSYKDPGTIYLPKA